MSELLTDDEILTALNDDGDNMLSEFKLRDARIVESLVKQKTHIVWIPNTGKPNCKKVLVCLSDGTFDIDDPKWIGWSLKAEIYVKEYAIIEE